MIADVTFTPGQLSAALGVIVFIGSGILMWRKLFNFVRLEDLDAAIRLKLSEVKFVCKEDLNELEKTIKDELEKHSKMRHEMRHEITSMQASLIRVQTLLETLPEKLRQGR